MLSNSPDSLYEQALQRIAARQTEARHLALVHVCPRPDRRERLPVGRLLRAAVALLRPRRHSPAQAIVSPAVSGPRCAG